MQQAAFPADNSWFATSLTEHDPVLDESIDLLFPSFLYNDIDFTNTLGTGYFYDNNATMENLRERSIDDYFSGGDPMGWHHANDTLLPHVSTSTDMRNGAATYQNQNASPTSSGVTTDAHDTFSFTPVVTDSASGQSSPKKRSAVDALDRSSTSPSSTSRLENTDNVNKRQRNTEAARRYRQRKVDRTSDLEEALASMTKERDDLKLKLARSQAEADVLRGMVGK